MLTRREARAGAGIATRRAAPTRHDGEGGNGGIGAEGRRALGRRLGDGQRSAHRVMSQWGRGAREARPFGARYKPAPSSQQGEQRRRAKTARAATATLAQKVDMLSGCGVVTGTESTQGGCHGGDGGA